MFEEVIVEVSKEKIAKLYGAAGIAEEKPDTGVKIINKSAYYIIRDCAKITKKYLPLFLYGVMENPLKDLKGKFTVADIKEFVKRCDTSKSAEQLLSLILKDIKIDIPEAPVEEEVFVPPEEDDDEYDPYSAYGMEDEEPAVKTKTTAVTPTMDVTEILIKTFNAKYPFPFWT